MTALEIAAGEIGYTESPAGSNRTKYGKWYGMDGQPWCMMFVQWCFDRAGHRLPYKTASCSALLNWYRSNRPEKLVTRPEAGDIVIYTFGHTGIIERDNLDGTITAIEGNTSPDDRGSQDNGGGVYRRKRDKGLVSGYIRPYEIREDYMTKDEILKELGDRYIETYDELPNWARKDMRELLDDETINGGTDAAIDRDDINMFLSDIKTVVICKRMIEKK